MRSTAAWCQRLATANTSNGALQIGSSGRAVDRVLLNARLRRGPVLAARREFGSSRPLLALKTQKLTDIGEGISQVEVIQWFVQEGAHVEEWGPLLEVQSDKAADTITSRYAGVVKKLYAKEDDIVKTGSALCDIEAIGEEEEVGERAEAKQVESNIQQAREDPAPSQTAPVVSQTAGSEPPSPPPPGKYATLATPAVRGLLKEHNIDILDIKGTGKDGRVMKEDVLKYLSAMNKQPDPAETSTMPHSPLPSQPATSTEQVETVQKMTALQAAMFRSMTASLQIPHFLYSDEINITDLTKLRQSLNQRNGKSVNTADSSPASPPKLTLLPFIVKALSLSLNQYPLLNARLAPPTVDNAAPSIIHRRNHNIGIAVDTPSGLIVPVIKCVQDRSIHDITLEIQRLTALCRGGKLTSADLSGGTITVSNVGNFGGNVVSPVIIEGQVAIVGVGRGTTRPVFDEEGHVVAAELSTLSWSADHRVLDGATVARAAGLVKEFLETPGRMVTEMR